MSQTQDNLIALLSRKKELLEQVLPCLEQERRCIVELNLEQLSEVLEAKSRMMQELQQLSKRCRAELAQLAAEVGVAETHSLSPLLPRLAQPQQEALRSLQGELLETGSRFEKLSRGNGDLLSGALATVNRSLEFFGRLLNRSATYGGTGQIVDGGNRPRIVCREI